MKPNVLRVALSALLLSTATGLAFAENNGRAPDGASAAAPRAVVVGGCTDVTKVNYKSDDSINKSTSSSSFTNVPNAGVSFNQGGTGNGCVIVTFTAETFARRTRLLHIRAQLDNGAIAAPGVVQLSGDDDEDGDGAWSRAHAFTFIFPSVAPVRTLCASSSAARCSPNPFSSTSTRSWCSTASACGRQSGGGTRT